MLVSAGTGSSFGRDAAPVYSRGEARRKDTAVTASTPPGIPDKKLPAESGGAELARPEGGLVSDFLGDLAATTAARYRHPRLWMRLGASAAVAAVVLLVPLLGLLVAVPAVSVLVGLAGVAALELDDGGAPRVRDLAATLAPRLAPLMLTAVFSMAVVFAWVFVPAVFVATTRLVLGAGAEGFAGALLFPWLAATGYYAFTGLVFALPAALVDGRVGPGAFAASRRAWGQARLRTLLSMGTAQLLVQAELLVIGALATVALFGVGVLGAALAPEGLRLAGALPRLLMACFTLPLISGGAAALGAVALALPTHQVLLYRKITQLPASGPEGGPP